jgi:hypothetical protein
MLGRIVSEIIAFLPHGSGFFVVGEGLKYSATRIIVTYSQNVSRLQPGITMNVRLHIYGLYNIGTCY